jgi:hypothetical protein
MLHNLLLSVLAQLSNSLDNVTSYSNSNVISPTHKVIGMRSGSNKMLLVLFVYFIYFKRVTRFERATFTLAR